MKQPLPDFEQLISAAREVRKNSYSPYSEYAVGAAVFDEQGRLFVGTNVENASYGATICAERAAILAMVAGGGSKITALAVVTDTMGSPCGMCLQVIQEFADGDLPIALADYSNRVEYETLSAFLPKPFEQDDLNGASKERT
jgi:cytidine deaminase